jgi:hypothetical protein
MTGIVLPMALNMKNQHMAIFYNISIPTFLVDCSISAMPTRFDRGGKNSLNPAKNPQLPKTSVSEVDCAGVPKIPNPAKNLRPLKIPLQNPKWPTKMVLKICQFFSEFWSTKALN